jgi:predicted transcriptional regulator YdeE
MIEIADFPNRVLLGLSRPFIAATQPGSNASDVIPPLWGEMSKIFFGMEFPLDPNPLGVGALWNDESGSVGDMIYFAGYEVSAVPENIDNLEVLVLEPSKYAFITYEGPMSELSEVITNFYTTLLPESGIPRREGMDLELYLETYDPQPKTIVTIAAPII